MGIGGRLKLPESAPAEVARDALDFPGSSDNMCEMLPSREAHQTQCLEFLLGADQAAPSAHHVLKFQTPRRKVGV